MWLYSVLARLVSGCATELVIFVILKCYTSCKHRQVQHCSYLSNTRCICSNQNSSTPSPGMRSYFSAR